MKWLENRKETIVMKWLEDYAERLRHFIVLTLEALKFWLKQYTSKPTRFWYVGVGFRWVMKLEVCSWGEGVQTLWTQAPKRVIVLMYCNDSSGDKFSFNFVHQCPKPKQRHNDHNQTHLFSIPRYWHTRCLTEIRVNSPYIRRIVSGC
jgi:hypothetical protein